jgi:hypothetical protein
MSYFPLFRWESCDIRDKDSDCDGGRGSYDGSTNDDYDGSTCYNNNNNNNNIGGGGHRMMVIVILVMVAIVMKWWLF